MHTTLFAGDSFMPPDTASASISQKPTVQPQVAQFLTPNFYQLAGDGIHFSLRTEGFRAPFVNYQDATRTLTFSGDQVRLVDVPDLGTVVSVTLLLTPDAGSTTFSVLLPQVNLPDQLGASERVRTQAITTVHKFSIAPQFDIGQREFYTSVRLKGTASRTIVPL